MKLKVISILSVCLYILVICLFSANPCSAQLTEEEILVNLMAKINEIKQALKVVKVRNNDQIEAFFKMMIVKNHPSHQNNFRVVKHGDTSWVPDPPNAVQLRKYFQSIDIVRVEVEKVETEPKTVLQDPNNDREAKVVMRFYVQTSLVEEGMLDGANLGGRPLESGTLTLGLWHQRICIWW